MGDATHELKGELKKGLEKLQTLRDEVRVRIHLAGMELKDQWNKLEPELEDIEKKAGHVSEASRGAVVGAIERLEKIRAALK
jgi:hypothetical protein